MILLTLNSNKYPSSYNKPPDNLVKCPLLESPEKYSHASQLTKYLSSMNLEGDTLLQIQKWWDVIIYTFCQSLSTNKSCPP